MTSSESRRVDRRLVWDLVRIAVPLAVVLLLAMAWQLTPLRELTPNIREAIANLRDMPAAPLVVVAVFVLGGVAVAPVSVLMLATVITFGPIRGGFYALAGVLASATLVFWIGRAVGQTALERIVGERALRIEKVLSNHGLVTVAVARNIPIAPFSVVNLIAGASPLRFRDYFFGTMLGFIPALVGLAIIGDGIVHFVQHPDRGSLLILAFLVVVLTATAVWAGRWLLRRVDQ
jgi:uncharacterized membrane protein YdjX (TVP38/TMEM64 family)